MKTKVFNLAMPNLLLPYPRILCGASRAIDLFCRIRVRFFFPVAHDVERPQAEQQHRAVVNPMVVGEPYARYAQRRVRECDGVARRYGHQEVGYERYYHYRGDVAQSAQGVCGHYLYAVAELVGYEYGYQYGDDVRDGPYRR